MDSMLKKMKLNLRSKKKKEKDRQEEKERWFLENGSNFLKELIADCNGISIPIRNFSSDQIITATSYFARSHLVSRNFFYEWYKGIIEDKSYLIKRFSSIEVEDKAYKDIVLSARMSNHSNFLKLFGCCYEFRFPVFVFEYAEHGVLNEKGRIMVNGRESILPWNVRLKIGKEIANALTYLHMAFPKITIHRDVMPTKILLDKNWTAKLSDFSNSVTLPEGKSRIENELVMGTAGYIDPVYLNKGIVSEYTDVYSFGVCLLVFLTGKPHVKTLSVKGLYEKGKLHRVIDPIAKDITRGQRLQVEACVVLALRCCEEKEEDRPKMIQVAKELKRIETSMKDSSHILSAPGL